MSADTSTTAELRRASTSSDTFSVSSESTACSFSKEKEEGQQQLDKEDKKQNKKGLRQKARDLANDMGKPPTTRQDAKEGKHTSHFLPVGGLVGEPMSRPAKV